jgi:phosphonate transport system substrate-binding protein
MKTGLNKKLIALALLAGLISFGITGCPGSEQPEQQAQTNENAGVKVNMPDGPLRVAFVPSVEEGEISLQLEEFESKLSGLIGHDVKSDIVLTYAACIEQMGAGHFDMAMLPSLAYVLAHDRYGIEVKLNVVRDGKATYRGQIITRNDSGIETLADLTGHTLGFTDPSSASGYMYPVTLLIQNGIDPDADLAETVYKGSHTAVVLSVLNGQVDAGACYDDARTGLLDTEPTVIDDTKIIAYTPDIPSDTVSLRSDCTGEFYDKVIDAMIELSREGKDGVLYRIYEIEELIPAQDSDYDPIREMATTLGIDLEEEIDKG